MKTQIPNAKFQINSKNENSNFKTYGLEFGALRFGAFLSIS